jgi:DNA-binding Xre family transcriptional regulator
MANAQHVGSSFDDYLTQEGVYSEVTTAALKRVLAWQIERAMHDGKMTKSMMAERMGTSRAALNRLLDPANTSITLRTLDRAASVLGKRLKLELVDDQSPKVSCG